MKNVILVPGLSIYKNLQLWGEHKELCEDIFSPLHITYLYDWEGRNLTKERREKMEKITAELRKATKGKELEASEELLLITKLKRLHQGEFFSIHMIIPEVPAYLFASIIISELLDRLGLDVKHKITTLWGETYYYDERKEELIEYIKQVECGEVKGDTILCIFPTSPAVISVVITSSFPHIPVLSIARKGEQIVKLR